MAALRFSFLGIPRLERDGRDVELTVAKAIALLAYLAVTNRPQHRDRVIDLLWPESAPDAARKNLRNTLWAMRKALGDEVLHAENEWLSLQDSLWVDVRQLEHVASISNATLSEQRVAADLYHGPLLDGLVLGDAPDFELWLAAERERLEQLYLRLVDSLIDRYRNDGRWAEIVQVARRALRQDNLQEPMYRALMEAHARQGERPEALRQYEQLQGVLEQELGVEPLPETEILRAAILNGELGHVVVPAPSMSRSARPSTTEGTTQVPFVGRQEELAALDAELAVAARGEARVVLLAGEVGIGKSRLWQEWS
ncbi:MAG: hypothetical protein M3220_08200, partial [Chloroflexota bacterium]|nr:hypothetical protein [Chloroflexota bacterium]